MRQIFNKRWFSTHQAQLNTYLILVLHLWYRWLVLENCSLPPLLLKWIVHPVTLWHLLLLQNTTIFSSFWLMKKIFKKGKTWTIHAIISIALNRRIRDVLWKHCNRQAGYALKKHISSLFIFTAAVLSIKAGKLEYVWLCPPTLACFSCLMIVTFRSHPCLCGFCFWFWFSNGQLANQHDKSCMKAKPGNFLSQKTKHIDIYRQGKCREAICALAKTHLQGSCAQSSWLSALLL